MVFTSHIFILYFLPLALAGYYALPARSSWRNAWLLLTSYVFYGWLNPWFVLLMLFIMLMPGGIAGAVRRLIEGRNRRSAAAR